MKGLVVFAAIFTAVAAGVALVSHEYVLVVINVVLCGVNCWNLNKMLQ